MIKRVKCIITIMIAMIVGVAFAAATPMEVSAASKTPAKVTITAAKSVDYNAVKLTWEKVKNAKQYQVYRATSKNGKYTKVKTTKSTYWTNTKLTTGKKYYYKVRAINGKKTGKFSSVKSVAPQLKKVTSLKVTSASYASCKITWGKVNGAKKYQIYRATTNKSDDYKLIKTTTSRSYTNTKLTTGKKYYYKVRAIRDSKKGSFSIVKSAVPTLNQVTGLNVESNSFTCSTVTWNKVSGAQGYQLYRATSKSGTYSRIKTANVNSFEDADLTPGKKYYYKVRAYRTVNGKKQYSPYSAVKSITMPAKEVATQFTYTVSEKEDITYENVIFNKDVTIQGDNGKIVFINCEFKGDVISKAKEGTKVLLIDGTTVDGECILNNGLKEGTFETALPKFITQSTIKVKTIDCYGAVYLEGDGKIIFNGVEYEKADCQYFINSSMELVEYTGQNGQVFGVAQWWENGEEKLMIVCE